MSENRLTVILIHEGEDKSDTKRVFSHIPKHILKVITVFVLDDKLLTLINCNSKGVKIESFPCFLITLNGDTTVYYSNEYKTVVSLINDILPK